MDLGEIVPNIIYLQVPKKIVIGRVSVSLVWKKVEMASAPVSAAWNRVVRIRARKSFSVNFTDLGQWNVFCC